MVINDSENVLNRYNLEDKHWYYIGLRKILERNFYKLFKGKTNFSSIKILDIGCGSGANLVWLRDFGEAYGIDISKVAIDCAEKRKVGNLTLGSAENLPYKDNYFDFAFSVQVFCNIPESDLKAWKEVYRVLKPGGYFISLLPAYNFLFSRHDVASGSYRRYNAKDILEKSNAAKFKLYKITFHNFFLFPLMAFIRLTSRFLSKGKLTAKTDLTPVNPLINYFLTKFIYFEVLLSNLVSYPCGLSVLSVHRKPEES